MYVCIETDVRTRHIVNGSDSHNVEEVCLKIPYTYTESNIFISNKLRKFIKISYDDTDTDVQ